MKDKLRHVQDNGCRQVGQPASRDEILEAISNEQARLTRLDREQADARTRLAVLEAELASLGSEPEIRVRLPLAPNADLHPIADDQSGEPILSRRPTSDPRSTARSIEGSQV
jgi:hypothetical protein